MFLSKENVISDKSIENAKKIYKNKQKKDLIKETLPKAWEKIITEPDVRLVDLLAETTEKLCGYKPDDETGERFLVEIRQVPKESNEEMSTHKYIQSKQIPHVSLENYAGKLIVSFTFKGNKYSVH